jgi:hypothetical protein
MTKVIRSPGRFKGIEPIIRQLMRANDYHAVAAVIDEHPQGLYHRAWASMTTAQTQLVWSRYRKGYGYRPPVQKETPSLVGAQQNILWDGQPRLFRVIAHYDRLDPKTNGELLIECVDNKFQMYIPYEDWDKYTID